MRFQWYYQRLLFFALFFNSVFSLQPSSYSCHDHERRALLRFKHSFLINCDVASDSSYAYPKVKSWGGEPQSYYGDCCSWDGVYCDEETSHVIRLDLSSSCLYGTFPSNSSLFELTHLRHLSLSDNHFNHSQIPSEFGQFSKLVSLNLSNSAFGGQIPLAISNLSMLSLLDLSHVVGLPKADSQLKLENPNLETLVHNLTRLSRLYLDVVDISSSMPTILTNLTFLKEGSFRYCNLYGQFPTNLCHLPHLEMLHLTGNTDLVGILPEFQPNSHLTKLDVSVTSFHGELPSSIGQLANVEELNLFLCHLTGPIPSSLGNLTKLTLLDLGGNTNAFSGDLPSSLTNLTMIKWLGLSHLNGRPERLVSWLSKLNQLTCLYLNFINFGGQIPSVIANLTSLRNMDLSENELTGEIPHWLLNLTQWNNLYMTDNQLEGPISSFGISRLVHLNTLWLGNNRNLHGNFDVFLKLKYLRFLDLGGAKLTFSSKNATNESVPKFTRLVLSSCNLTEFPQFLQSQDELHDLDLSNNNIRGFIPQWFVKITQESLNSLDLSNNFLRGFEQPVMVLPWSHLERFTIQGNQLQGPLPIPPSSLAVYQVSNNQLTGEIPHEICQASSMNYFDISNNNLSGRIPRCIGDLGRSLFVLNLKGNKFHGTIPHPYSKLCSLKMIDLSENQLDGSMPRSLANCMNLEVVDIGRNHVNDTFPSWLGGLPRLSILVLRHNNFHGRIGRPKIGYDFHSLRIIDLSNNFHTGDLPFAYLQGWVAMKATNGSQSTASGTTVQYHKTTVSMLEVVPVYYDYPITITNKGNDMQYTKVLTVFRVIDFSRNNFTGKIPSFMGELRGLQVLNLSNNNLQGEIPSSLANMTYLESLDLSNNLLSGEIPQSLAQLTFLEVFNVSQNLLKGPIPQGKQFGTFDNSSFVGNSGLCGTPLSKSCGNAFEPPPPAVADSGAEEEEEESMLIDWIIRCLGCVSGLAVGYAFGKYLTDRNHEWFVETFGRRRSKRGATTRGRSTAVTPRS